MRLDPIVVFVRSVMQTSPDFVRKINHNSEKYCQLDVKVSLPRSSRDGLDIFSVLQEIKYFNDNLEANITTFIPKYIDRGLGIDFVCCFQKISLQQVKKPSVLSKPH